MFKFRNNIIKIMYLIKKYKLINQINKFLNFNLNNKKIIKLIKI